MPKRDAFFVWEEALPGSVFHALFSSPHFHDSPLARFDVNGLVIVEISQEVRGLKATLKSMHPPKQFYMSLYII